MNNSEHNRRGFLDSIQDQIWKASQSIEADSNIGKRERKGLRRFFDGIESQVHFGPKPIAERQRFAIVPGKRLDEIFRNPTSEPQPSHVGRSPVAKVPLE
jgi:hypothetical protein